MFANTRALAAALLEANPAACAVLARDLTVIEANVRFSDLFDYRPSPSVSTSLVSLVVGKLPVLSREASRAKLLAAAGRAFEEGRTQSVVIADAAIDADVAQDAAGSESGITWRIEFNPLAVEDATGAVPAMVVLVKSKDAAGEVSSAGRKLEGAAASGNDDARDDSELRRLLLEARYHALVKVASSAAYVCDAMGRFVVPQPSWESYTGQPWEKHQGYGWAEMIHPDDRLVAQTALNKSLETDGPYRADVRLWHAASSTYRRCQIRAAGSHDESGAIYEWVGMITDVEETLINAQSLTEERERLDLSIQAAEIGTFHCPIPLDRIIWNVKCKEHFWLPANAEVGFDLFYARIHPDDRQKTRDAVEKAVNEGVPYDIEYRTASPSGDIRWIRAKGRTHVDEAGRPLRFDGITIDVSSHKALEMERDRLLTNERLLRLEAQHANQLKDAFLATVSHELRTPLNAMQSWLYLLQHENTDPELIARGIEAIDRNVELQTRLVDDLLDLSRIAAGKLFINSSEVDLVPLLVAEISDVELAARAKGVEIVPQLADTLLVEGDPLRLRQVFSNVLSNALKYSSAKGKIDIVASRAGNWAEIRVEDNGAGIPASFINHVFEPFAQASQATTRRFGGLGIGLAIAKSIVTLHGGSITAQSEGDGRGSTFVVHIPLLAEDREPPAGPPLTDIVTSSRDEALAGIRVLLVEDEADVRDAMLAVLESAGAGVRGAESAPEARRQIDAEQFDVILSDIGMPDEDGYSLIRSLRQQANQTPAIAVTAFGRPEDRARALQAGFDLHMPKPVEPMSLFRAIRELLRI
ncbi:MAG: Two-component system sensor histidine kinase/response regulator hybrid [uncultured Paraburkholderia sp.]|nr:MAG: Two-component system sensor histidine kinase/response regulator hybrid [uncultured Paraburkholderia sp.]CAH2923466.1 MAG: Two-component system sensor histidine kinase/response regulator hybrid [uncultured Paraburkholderia sp.]